MKTLQRLLLASALALFPALKSQAYSNLHDLVYTNGANPQANLLLTNGVLYGTALRGGFSPYVGTIFRMNPDGSSFTNLHSFNGDTEGFYPSAGLVLVGSTLYGTAGSGGSGNSGTIYKINTNGTGFAVVYNFPPNATEFPYSNATGAYPQCALVLSGSTLFGTTGSGGTNGFGTLFSVSTNGTGYINMHNFTSPGVSSTDGAVPACSLILGGDTLYGNTIEGGLGRSGTIFSIKTNGTAYTSIYNFEFTTYNGTNFTNSEGVYPLGDLVLGGDTLYGVAQNGGYAANGSIYSLKTNGSNFHVLYNFSPKSGTNSTNYDGVEPLAGLTLSSNALYGTTSAGGLYGNGTIFTLNTNGTGFSTMYQFSAMTNLANQTNFDGAKPWASMILSSGKLYGTTSQGGSLSYGTLFSLVLAPSLAIQRSGTNAIITWATSPAGFTLQYATNPVLSAAWSNAIPAPVIVNGLNTVTNAATNKVRFYRLVQ